MSENYRHHTATRDRVQVVFVPIEIGSPKQATHPKPPAYPQRGGRDAWRPATLPPRRLTKGETVRNLLDEFARQDEVVREMMRPNPQAFLARYGGRGQVAP